MNGFCWWLADLASRALEPHEREAVRGDLAESGETGGRALLEVLGLALRRQSALWMHWRPWLALVGLVLPLGVLLCWISRQEADGSAIYFWLYASYWEPAFLINPSLRHDLVLHAGAILTGYFTLFCWSWSSGFLLGSVSRRSLPFLGILFVSLVLFGAYLGEPPRHFGRALFHRARDFSSHSPVFELVFFRVLFPVILQFALVLSPSFWGMIQAERARKFPPRFRRVLWLAAIATLPAVAIQTGLVTVPYMKGSIAPSMAQIVAYWPAAYFIAAGARRRHGHPRLVERSNA